MILVVVDVQRGLDDPQYGPRSNPGCERTIGALLDAWRTAGLEVVFTRHFSAREGSPLSADRPTSEIKESVAPLAGESVFVKWTNSAFKNPDFAGAMADAASPLVFAGMATDACVTATVREARDLGYDVSVVADACATFDRRDRHGEVVPADLVDRVSLAALAASGIRLLSTADAVRMVRPPATVDNP